MSVRLGETVIAGNVQEHETETWTITFEDGSTTTKKMLIKP